MARWRVGARWYAVALILLVLILLVLLSMRALVSAAFAPNLFAIGIVFGLVPAFLEEIGCTGFAFPALSTGRGALSAGLLLGVLWGLWHLPVVDHLGAAGPHGAYAVPFAVAFVSAMTALRALISWLYIRTESVLLAQLMHLSSTGSLVVLGPAHVSPAQEALWYGVYAGALWFVVVLIATQSRLR